MKMHTFVTLSVTTIVVPPSRNPGYPGDRVLAGLGLFVARSRAGRLWRFANRSAVIGAGERDDLLLSWLAEHLPTPTARLISWQLDSHVMPLLIDVASTAPPGVAQATMAKVADAMQTGPVDLALDHGGAMAPPFADIAAGHAIGAPITTDVQRVSDWSWGDTDRLRTDAADEAVAMWRLFLRRSRLAGLEAEAATDRWLALRRHMRSVPSKNPAGKERVRRKGEGKTNPASDQGDLT